MLSPLTQAAMSDTHQLGVLPVPLQKVHFHHWPTGEKVLEMIKKISPMLDYSKAFSYMQKILKIIYIIKTIERTSIFDSIKIQSEQSETWRVPGVQRVWQPGIYWLYHLHWKLDASCFPCHTLGWVTALLLETFNIRKFIWIHRFNASQLKSTSHALSSIGIVEKSIKKQTKTQVLSALYLILCRDLLTMTACEFCNSAKRHQDLRCKIWNIGTYI